MAKLTAEALTREVDEEAVRTVYPLNFPVLPEIPGARYVDQEFYELELEHVWKKTWLYAGHESEISNPGDYMLFDKIGQSILIIRQNSGEVAAFHNICRHRGASLVIEPTGNAKRLTCPYHAWTYNLSGELKGVPNEFDFGCFDKATRNLIPVHIHNFRGILFVNVSDTPQPFEEFAPSVIEAFAGFPLDEFKVQGKLRVEAPINWKALKDNFSESYHVPVVHAETVAKWLDPSAYHMRLLEHGHHIATNRKREASRFGETSAPTLEVIDPIFERHTLGIHMFPNGVTAVDPSGFGWITMWPVGRDRCVLEVTFLGYHDGSAEHDDYWKHHLTGVEHILGEDLRLMGAMQKSQDGGHFTGMLISFRERAIYWMHEEIDRMIGHNRIPQALHVAPVISEALEGRAQA
jgi:Phenylpropionate dioxygenase and related ring-hydroxylating dioxygenases, large terminal subunit